MTHRVSLYIALAIIGFFLFDWVAHDGAWAFVIAEKTLALLEWVTFWR